MGIKVTWANIEQTAIRWDFDSFWSWREFKQAQATSNFMAMTVSHTVHIIGNLKNSRFLPKNPFIEFTHILKNAPSNRGVMILVGCSYIVQVMVNTFQRLYPVDIPAMHMVDDIMEAYTVLDQYAPTPEVVVPTPTLTALTETLPVAIPAVLAQAV